MHLVAKSMNRSGAEPGYRSVMGDAFHLTLRPDEGLRLKTSASRSLCGEHLTLINFFDTTFSVFHSFALTGLR